MRTGPTNQQLQGLIALLKRESRSSQSGVWAAVASDLEASTRRRRVVNLSRLNRHTNKGETIVVPGKVLGSGTLDHSLTVAAWAFSESAKEEIKKANGTTMTILDLMKKDPKAKGIKLIG